MEYLQHIQYLQGTVTQIDPTLYSFKCIPHESNEVTVFVAPCAAINPTDLPRIGDNIIIKNVYRHASKEYFMLPDSRLFCKKSTERIQIEETNEFLDLIRLHRMTPANIVTFHLFYKGVDIDCEENPSRIKWVLLQHVLENDNVLQGNLLVCSFITPTDCQFVAKEHVYDKYPYHGFIHGVHHGENLQYLVGYLCVNRFGLFELWNGNTCIHLKILARNNHDLLGYQDKFIIIKNFMVFTELYEEGVNFDYAMCDVDDVGVLGLTGSRRDVKDVNVREVLPKGIEYEHVYTVYIQNVGLPNSTSKKTTEIWLEVLVLKDEEWEHQYVCLEKTLFNVLPYLDVGNVYDVHSKTSWIPHLEIEIRRLTTPTVKLYKIEGNEVYFVKNNSCPLPMPASANFLELKEVNALLKADTPSKRYINFEAVIDLKVYGNKNSESRTKQQIKSIAYGTPGNKTHVLKFDPIDEDSVAFSMFLNNWERKLCPLGLLPHMKVVVRHAEVAKNYLKSNGLTNFKIVGYSCPIKFNTANLLSTNSKIFYSLLGDGHHIPLHVLVRTRVRFKRIKIFKITCVEGEVKFSAIFITRDEKGEACVITQSLDFLKLMLPKSVPFEQWLEKFREIKYFNIYDEEPETSDGEICTLYKAIYNCLFLTLNGGLLYVDMLCRRIEPKQLSDNRGVPLWYATDILELIM